MQGKNRTPGSSGGHPGSGIFCGRFGEAAGFSATLRAKRPCAKLPAGILARPRAFWPQVHSKILVRAHHGFGRAGERALSSGEAAKSLSPFGRFGDVPGHFGVVTGEMALFRHFPGTPGLPDGPPCDRLSAIRSSAIASSHEKSPAAQAGSCRASLQSSAGLWPPWPRPV